MMRHIVMRGGGKGHETWDNPTRVTRGAMMKGSSRDPAFAAGKRNAVILAHNYAPEVQDIATSSGLTRSVSPGRRHRCRRHRLLRGPT